MRQNTTNQITRSITRLYIDYIYGMDLLLCSLYLLLGVWTSCNGESVLDVCNGVVFNKCYL